MDRLYLNLFFIADILVFIGLGTLSDGTELENLGLDA